MAASSYMNKDSLKQAVSVLVEQAYNFDYQEKYEIACSLLEDVRKLVPDSGHNNSTEIKWNMSSCLGGIQNMILHNFLDTWLMAAPCNVKLGYYRHEFQQLQLNRWVQYIRGTGSEISGILKNTKYIFITWDLSNLGSDDWNDKAIEQVGKMLKPLGEQTQKGITVHRIIFINLKNIRTSFETRRKLFNKIWYIYFYHYCNKGNKNYRISFIDKEPFITALGINKSRRLDIAFFSNSDEVLKEVDKEVIPFADNEVCLGYHAAQYTARTDIKKYPSNFCHVESPKEFLNLYISEADPKTPGCIANNIICYWVKETQQLLRNWYTMSKPGLCDGEIRDNLSKTFAEELGSDDLVPDIGDVVGPMAMVKITKLAEKDKNEYEQGVKFESLFKNDKR